MDIDQPRQYLKEKVRGIIGVKTQYEAEVIEAMWVLTQR